MKKRTSEVIDVIVPNYNKGLYIAECLFSLLSQTYKHWRCIVVDGFSEDGSWEIIQAYAKNDSRFEIYQIPRQGLYQSWNFGLSKVTNSYFCILTSDDVWDRKWLEIAHKRLAAHPAAICVASRTRIIDINGKLGDITPANLLGETLFKIADNTVCLLEGIDSSVACYFLLGIYSSIHSLLMRSSILNQGETFAEDLGSAADYEWYIKLGLYGKIIYCNDIEAAWRFYEGQASQPWQQKQYGELLQKINRRNRDWIAEKLGAVGDNFKDLAEEYDRHILRYDTDRPCLKKLYINPVLTLLHLLQVAITMPKEFLLDCYFKMLGKRFVSEQRLKLSQKIYQMMVKTTNK